MKNITIHTRTTTNRKPYTQPCLQSISLDYQISLILNSVSDEPPIFPGEENANNRVGVSAHDPYKGMLG